MEGNQFLYLNFISKLEIGVYKKILGQVKAIEKIIGKINCTYTLEDYFYLNNKPINKYILKNTKFSKIKRRTQVLSIYNTLKKIIKKNGIKIIYIRYYRTNTLFLFFLRELKKLDAKIILEIPTYPYDQEVNSLNFILIVDKILRRKNKKYVDKIVTYSEDKVIWGIPCINISNGIDLEEVKIIAKKEYEGMKFISVSNCSFWHGIDRFLYSLLQYKKNGGKEKIKFHIVGEGSETPKLKKIVEDNQELQDIVIFHGFKVGEELDEIYNNSDIGLGALASFRQGTNCGSSLKGAEYCAKGIPFILGAKDNRFIKCNFSYLVSNDESLLDIEKIIEWYKNLKVTPEEIRKYAEDNLSWDKQMKKVIDNI